MPRLGHGRPITDEDIDKAKKELAEFTSRTRLAFALAPPVSTQPFDLLFPILQEDEANLLPRLPDTPAKLKRLGAAMTDDDQGNDPGRDGPIPAAYTYLGQFIDHDITLEIQNESLGSGKMAVLLDPGLTPLTLEQIRVVMRNQRSATLDLDSVYGSPAPRDPNNDDKLLVGNVHKLELRNPPEPNRPPLARPKGKGDDNDLPRKPRNTQDPSVDREALIGDPRNDENTIISQLHVAFLKAHNVLIDQGLPFREARRALRQHYQHIVIHDFLKRVADPEIVDDVIVNGNRWFNPYAEPIFMPLEFAVAAYRFGHSMVRGLYNFNSNFRIGGPAPASLDLLFVFTALSGQLGEEINLPPAETLPENWIIEWENIVGSDGAMKARKIDTNLAATGGGALFRLKSPLGAPEQPADAARLAVRNLLRGYRLRMPTGQAVADLLGVRVLSKDQIRAAAGNDEQRAALDQSEFLTRTPLWYYILAEAKALGNDGAHLGPVGSTIVAEVLVGLVRRSDDSILKSPGWKPTLPSEKPGEYELADLLRLAKVLPGPQAEPRTYTVKRGDTLAGIAADKLGNQARWPQIFVLNRAVIANPNRILPGQVLLLPPREPVGTIPRLYTVVRGDTLTGIAREKLGDGDRWREIFDLNRDVIADPDRIVIGQVLVIPNS